MTILLDAPLTTCEPDDEPEPVPACYVCGHTDPDDLDHDCNRDWVCREHLTDWASNPDYRFHDHD